MSHDHDHGSGGADDALLKSRVRALLDERSFSHVTIEVEAAGDACPQRENQ